MYNDKWRNADIKKFMIYISIYMEFKQVQK